MAWRTETFLPSAPPLGRRSFVIFCATSATRLTGFGPAHDLPSHSRSAFDEVLTRAGPLPANFANNGDTLRKSRIYVAPAQADVTTQRAAE
jgi:CheB methylesterase